MKATGNAATLAPRGITIEAVAQHLGVRVFTAKLFAALGMPGSPDAYRPIVETAREVARYFDVNRRTINDWKQRGMPERSDGTYDLASIASWRESTTGKACDGRLRIAAAACRVVMADFATGLAAAVDDLVRDMNPTEANQLRERLAAGIANRMKLPDCVDLAAALQECESRLNGN